MFSAHVLAKTS